jgi:hypothetical protein
MTYFGPASLRDCQVSQACPHCLCKGTAGGAIGFKGLSNGVMRILTDQLNSHIQRVAKNRDIPIHWWPSEGGGTDGAKSKFVEQKYANTFTGKGNHVFCILTNKEPVRIFYVHDALLCGFCYLKISSYLPFHAECYFNGHNAIQLQLDKQGIKYRLKENAFSEHCTNWGFPCIRPVRGGKSLSICAGSSDTVFSFDVDTNAK